MLGQPAAVVYPVEDLAAAKAWYCWLLGVAPEHDYAGYLGFLVGDFEIGLDPDGRSEGLTGPVLCYEVADISETYQALLAAGASPFVEPQTMSGASIAYLRDPEGNPLGLLQRTPEGV